MLSSAHVLAMNAKHLLDVIDKIRMNYHRVNELVMRGVGGSNPGRDDLVVRGVGSSNTGSSQSSNGSSMGRFSAYTATTSSSQSMSDNGGSS